MTLYLATLFCYALMPLSLLAGQGLLFPALVIVVLLLRRVAVLEQQVAYLLQKDSAAHSRRVRDIGLKQASRVKEL